MIRILVSLLAILLLISPLAGQLAPDGLGWGPVRLGADYESAKKSLQGESWSLYYRLGAGPGELTTYGKRFGAKPPAKLRSSVREYRVFSEFWKGTIWDFTVSLQGVDPKEIRAELTRFFGPPEDLDEYNASWRTSRVKVSGFFMRGDASLHFIDLEVNARIEKQQLVDQGLEPGEPSGRGPLRRPTPAEAAWIAGFLATARDALPPPPEGFEVVEQSGVAEPELIDNLDDKHPLKREYVLVLVDRQRQEASEQALREALEASRTSQQAKIEQAQAELQSKLETLQQRAAEAVAKGDMAAAQRVQQEAVRLASQVEGAAKEAEAALRTELREGKPKDVRLFVKVAVNEDEALDLRLKPAQTVAGHKGYFRVIPAEDNLEEETETVVILGAWKPAAPDAAHQLAALRDPALSNTAGQNLQIQVRGDAARARAYLEAIHWDQLEGLLKP
jgi:hypothetical protein